MLDWFFSLETQYRVTIVGIFVTAIMSGISLFFSVRNNRAVHYVNSITKSRIEWIQKLRNMISEFISKTNVYNNAYYRKDYDKSGEHLSECQECCTEIKLLLNYSDRYDKEICDLLDKILEAHREYYDRVHNMAVDEDGYFVESNSDKKLKEEVEKSISLLMRKVHIYLKSEWNRVKYESQGKIYEKETQEFDILELEKKYDDPKYKNLVWKRFFINTKAKVWRIWNSSGLVIFMAVVAIVLIRLLLFKIKRG